MPYRALDIPEAAGYLHLTGRELENLVKTTDIPCEYRGDRVVFFRSKLDAWASRRILGLPAKRLVDYHQKSTRASREIFDQDALMPDLLLPGFIEPSLKSKTKKSVIRDMAALAETTGRVMDPAALIDSVEDREALCSTALPGGVALLHCRDIQPYRFEDSFMVIGRTLQDIHFGASDGHPTRLFFLICCQDERIHLHTLARLCLIMLKTEVITLLLTAPDAEAMRAVLLDAEQQVITSNQQA